MSEAVESTNIVLIDAARWPGHSAAYTARLVRRIQEHNCTVALVANEDFRTSAARHIPTPPSAAELGVALQRFGTSPIVDLSLTATTRAGLDPALRGREVTRVLHDVHVLRRSDDESPWRVRGHFRRRWFLHRLRQSMAEGHRLVVHTALAQTVLSAHRLQSQLVPLPSMLPDQQPCGDDRAGVLLIGGVRPGRGFWSGLEAAIAAAAGECEVIVAGVANPGSHELPSSVRTLPRLPEADLLDLYRSVEVVVLPYPKEWGAHGAASLVLQEALHLGANVAATPLVAAQSKSPSLFCAADHSTAALADAIRAALRSGHDRASASAGGSASDYVRDLVGLG